jgi:hypothetical protein
MPSGWGADKPETTIVVPVVRVVVVPIRGTHVLPVVVPAPAAVNAVRPIVFCNIQMTKFKVV